MVERSARLTAAAVTLVTAAVCLPSESAGQGVEEGLEKLGSENGRLYAAPVSSGLGAGMNSGWFHSAGVLEPLRVEVGVRAAAAFVPDADETYEPVLPEEVTVEELDGRTFRQPYGTGEGLVAPTAVGERRGSGGVGLVVEPRGELREALLDEGMDPADFALEFPDGFNIPAVPLVVLQVNAGLPLGTEATVRFIPTLDVQEDVGAVRSLGFGLKHSLDQWIPGDAPLNVSVAGGYQTFDAGDYLAANSRHLSLVVSRTLSTLTLFASGTVEESDVDIGFTVVNPRLPEHEARIELSAEGANSSRMTAGFNLDLLFLQLNAAYSISTYDVVTAGLNLRF